MKTTIAENKSVKDWADTLVPCRMHKEFEGSFRRVCPVCGRLFEDVTIVIYDTDQIRVYDKKTAEIRGQLYVAAPGSDAIRILKFPTSSGVTLSEIPEKHIELFARPIELSDNNPTGG